MEIRKADVVDIDIVYEFERQYFIEHEPENLLKWEREKEKTMDFLLNRMTQMFVSVEDQSVVGYAYWDLLGSEPDLYSIYVDPDYRGKGIAYELMTAIEEHVLDRGYDAIKLETLVTNPARFLFEKKGYIFDREEEGWLYYRKNLEEEANE